MKDDATNRPFDEGTDDIVDHDALKGSPGSETSSQVLKPSPTNSSSLEMVLVAMRNNARKRTVQENGCAALGHMASMDDMNKESIVNAKGIQVIIQGTNCIIISSPIVSVTKTFDSVLTNLI
jgi:hypothetical protein